MNKTLIISILVLIQVCLAAKERKLRIIPMNISKQNLNTNLKEFIINLDDVMLTPGISSIQIESIITCYGVNANRSVSL